MNHHYGDIEGRRVTCYAAEITDIVNGTHHVIHEMFTTEEAIPRTVGYILQPPTGEEIGVAAWQIDEGMAGDHYYAEAYRYFPFA